MMDPTSLEDKLVLVTGAGTGIGQGVALELARRGADVALHYSSSATGANAAVEQIIATGRRAAAFQGDLSKVEDCRRVVDQAAAFLGGLDGLVSNAGITATYDFLEVTPEQFDQWVRPENFDKFFWQDPPESPEARADYARQVLARFVRNAYRRPSNEATLDKLLSIAQATWSTPGRGA